MRFTNLNIFHDKLGMPYIQSVKQSMIMNKYVVMVTTKNMLLWLHFFNKLFITKIFLISIYKSVQNS